MSSNQTITGSCRCRQIRYEVVGSPKTTLLCHCENCRKTTGSMFMANSFYLQSQFQILAGENLLKTYQDSKTQSGNTLTHSFCSNCGSPLFITNKSNPMTKDAVIVTAGSMDFGAENEPWVPQKEVFCKRRAEWLPKIESTRTSQMME